jgi:hypothetical protein
MRGEWGCLALGACRPRPCTSHPAHARRPSSALLQHQRLAGPQGAAAADHGAAHSRRHPLHKLQHRPRLEIREHCTQGMQCMLACVHSCTRLQPAQCIKARTGWKERRKGQDSPGCPAPASRHRPPHTPSCPSLELAPLPPHLPLVPLAPPCLPLRSMPLSPLSSTRSESSLSRRRGS